MRSRRVTASGQPCSALIHEYSTTMTESMSGPNSSSSSDRSSSGMARDVLLLTVGFKLLTVSGNVSSMWLANGFGVGIMLTAPRRHWPALLAAVAVGGMAAAFYLHSTPGLIF